jgi:dihydroxy-acid dehydratase
VIGLVKNGDKISIDLKNRKLDLLVSDGELAERRKTYEAPAPRVKRGYLKFYSEHVAPASEGAVMPRF